jgi:methyl-accepting chemotaxis protein
MDMSEVISVLKLRQFRIAMMVAFIFLCIWIIFFIFILRLLNPLNEISKITRRMADGHLNESIEIGSGGSIAEIRENINDLGVNFQEILLHFWKHTTDVIKCLELIKEKMGCQTEQIGNLLRNDDESSVRCQIEADIEQIHQSMADMQELIQGFDLYDIHLDQEKVMAGEKTFGSNKEIL